MGDEGTRDEGRGGDVGILHTLFTAHSYTDKPYWSHMLGRQNTSPRPLVPILEPGSRLAPRCPACEMETFANLANPHPYQRQRVSYTMTRVFQHYVFGKHAP